MPGLRSAASSPAAGFDSNTMPAPSITSTASAMLRNVVSMTAVGTAQPLERGAEILGALGDLALERQVGGLGRAERAPVARGWRAAPSPSTRSRAAGSAPRQRGRSAAAAGRWLFDCSVRRPSSRRSSVTRRSSAAPSLSHQRAALAGGNQRRSTGRVARGAQPDQFGAERNGALDVAPGAGQQLRLLGSRFHRGHQAVEGGG